jgi:hypothetical protein
MITIRRRTLGGVLAGALLAAGISLTVQQPAWAYDSLPCDTSNGVTAADTALAEKLNPLLDDDMRGAMTGYTTSCARVITQTIKGRGLPERAAVIAVTTAIVETHLHNYTGGDLDSLGLFQQRSGWGTDAQRLDAVWSTNRFINEMLNLYPNNSWQTTPIGEVCQGVQRSAYPDRYAYQVSDATTIVDHLWDANLPADRPGVAVVSRKLTWLDVFAKASDGSFLHRNFNGDSWSGWVRLGGQFKSNPAAYATENRIDVLGVGLDGELWQNTWLAGVGWSGWKDTGGGQIQWTPAVTSRADGTLDVFAVNTSEVVVYRNFNGSSWSAWSSIGATATAPPAATALGSDRLNVLIRDADGTLSTRMWTRSHGWYSWVDRGKKIFGGPGVSHRTDLLMDVFVRDPADKSLMHAPSTDGGVSLESFVDLGGVLTTPPSAVSMYDKRIDVITRGADGALYQRVWSYYNSGWYAWTSLGPIP